MVHSGVPPISVRPKVIGGERLLPFLFSPAFSFSLYVNSTSEAPHQLGAYNFKSYFRTFFPNNIQYFYPILSCGFMFISVW